MAFGWAFSGFGVDGEWFQRGGIRTVIRDADGRLGPDRVFVADSLLAKHDENYVPRELADIDMNAAAHTKDTLVP